MGSQQLPGDEEHNMRVSDIQDRIGRGEYQVDNQAVAAAIVARLLQGHRLAAVEPSAQEECS